MGGEIVLLAQDDGEAAPGRVARDAGAVDAAADDQEVAVSLIHVLLFLLHRQILARHRAAGVG